MARRHERPISRLIAFDVSDRLRVRSWIVPAYTMPRDLEDVTVLRVVVREGLSRDLVDCVVDDLDRIIKELNATPSAPGRPGGTGVSRSSKAGPRGVC